MFPFKGKGGETTGSVYLSLQKNGQFIDWHDVKGEHVNKNWKGGCNEEMSGLAGGCRGCGFKKTLPLGVFIPDMAH